MPFEGKGTGLGFPGFCEFAAAIQISHAPLDSGAGLQSSDGLVQLLWPAGGWPEAARNGALCSFCQLVGHAFLYLGGMFLNDAFDAGFDRNHRPTRPIPSGAIPEGQVWVWGFAWLVLGLTGLFCLGGVTGVLGLFLVGCILFYNAIHKIMILAPAIMGGCRFFVYLVAASIGLNGVTGESIWKGLALAAYIVGLSYLARKESALVRMRYWPCVFLTAPRLVAWQSWWMTAPTSGRRRYVPSY